MAVALAGCVPTAALSAKYAGEFMAIGGGARPLGMGGAFAAVASDVSSVYWNPAGITGIGTRQALAMHSERFGGLVKFNFGSYAQPTELLGPDREAAWGLGLIHLGVEDLIITNHLEMIDSDGDGQLDDLVDKSGNVLTEADIAALPRESDNSFALLGSFATRTGWGRVGGTLKLIYTDAIAGESSVGIGIDLGYLYRDFLFDRFDVGAKLQDATGTYISWSTGTNEFITPMLKVGAAYTLVSERMNGALLLAADADLFFEDRRTASQFWIEGVSSDLHLGAELQFQEKVMVRGGVDGGNPTAGAGVRVGFLGFDYAYLHHDAFEATHRVSVLADF
jgi:hypothetical protein